MTRPISSDNLLLSVPQIDNQHRDLIAMVNEFLAAADAGAPRTDLDPQLTRLARAFQVHFDSEEALMRSSNFPGVSPHTADHRKLIDQMNSLRDSLATGDVKVGGALVLFVRLWTEQHIKGPDLAFAQFLLSGKTPA
jgi:hemerythrin